MNEQEIINTLVEEFVAHGNNLAANNRMRKWLTNIGIYGDLRERLISHANRSWLESRDRAALMNGGGSRQYRYNCIADYHGNRVLAGSFDTIQEMEMYLRGAVYNTQYKNGVVWEYFPGRDPEFQLV